MNESKKNYIPKEIADMMIDLVEFSLLKVSPSFFLDNPDLRIEATVKILQDYFEEKGIDGVFCDEPL